MRKDFSIYMQEEQDPKVLQEEEFMVHLKTLREEHAHLMYSRYFFHQAAQWYRRLRMGQVRGQVILVGCSIPEELVMAAGVMPVRILGGSHESCSWSEDLVPRDTDPVSRSVLGYLQCLSNRDNLYVIPSNSDSMRKIAYQLIRDGEKVCVVDLPPAADDPSAITKWKEQMLQMMEAVAVHVRGRMTGAKLKDAVRKTVKARLCLRRFMEMVPEYDRILSASARILIQNSYYYTQDPEAWTWSLRKLMQEISRKGSGSTQRNDENPRILLMGSPVYFPNDKIPRLLTEAGLCIRQQADVSENIRYVIPRNRRGNRSLRKLTDDVIRAWCRADVSSAYTKNERMRDRIRRLASASQVEGAVCLVLKGQIEQDFELAYCEKMLDTYNIPVFRLETDYQYQDVEQLRIRMEAFTEMLIQNRCRKAEMTAAKEQWQNRNWIRKAV